MPCCGVLYCEECIHSHLLENDFVCPNCLKRINSLERLIIDKPMRTRVADYIDKTIKESNEVEDARGNTEDRIREVYMQQLPTVTLLLTIIIFRLG